MDELIAVLQKEIEWHKSLPKTEPPWAKGFIRGIEHCIHLIKKIKEISEDHHEDTLLRIRDRKIKLLEDEVALLKKILAGFQNRPMCDSGQDKWPVGCCSPEKDRAELETEGYPKYNELSGGKDA